MAEPQAKVDMDPVYETRLRELQQHAAAELAARGVGGQVKWDRPDGWTAGPFAVQAIEVPFSRAVSNEAAVAAIADPKNPGVTGDLVAAATMIETLACMERAFRSRHTMRRPRAVAQMLSRRKGHGDPTGVFGRNGVEYVRQILKQARAPQ